MDWFEILTGFRETDYDDTRAKLKVEGSRLRSLVNGKDYGIGELDSSLRDVKQDDSNNEVAPSRGGEQIDDVLDGLVGAVVGGFESAVWAMLRVRTVVEAAVGKWSAQPFVEEQK